LNDKRWKLLRAEVFKRTNGLCELCLKEGIYTPGVDVHHIRPVEQAKTVQEMERLAYDPNNCQLLCVACHIKVHQDMRTHTKEKVAENKARARQRFMEQNDPNYKEENNQETMQQNKRLGIFGTLNYEKLKDMTMDERKLAVTNHAKDVLSRKTMDGKGPQIPDDDHDPYDVTAEYTIMDCRYNKQGKILATFKAQRTIEGLTIELTSFESVTS
jgi:5-methylcytosine-specific restriction protein A